MLYIAENLKMLRTGRGLTQEEVAQMLLVSPQSVSKWERGDTYPDIALLPALANLFETSIDALVGMDKINGRAARAAVFSQAHAHLRAGAHGRAAQVLEEALKTFPNDKGLLSELALALSFEDSPQTLQKSAGLCEQVLSGNVPEAVGHTTRAALCLIYLKLGEKDRAASAARKLPHVRESREEVLALMERDPGAADISAYLRFIALGEQEE